MITCVFVLFSGAVFICTEDVFPNKRLMQMVDLLKKRIKGSFAEQHSFSDNIFIEHAADMVRFNNCLLFLSKQIICP